MFRWNRSVGFSKMSYPVKREVLFGEKEVLSDEKTVSLNRMRPRVFL